MTKIIFEISNGFFKPVIEIGNDTPANSVGVVLLALATGKCQEQICQCIESLIMSPDVNNDYKTTLLQVLEKLESRSNIGRILRDDIPKEINL